MCATLPGLETLGLDLFGLPLEWVLMLSSPSGAHQGLYGQSEVHVQLAGSDSSLLHPEIKTLIWVTSNDCSILHMLTSSLQLGTYAVRESLIGGPGMMVHAFKRFDF